MIVGITGASGNMGKDVCLLLVKNNNIDKIRIFGHSKKNTEKLLKKLKKYQHKIELMYGDIANIFDVTKFINNLDYVINMAAVIPPLADKYKDLAIRTNELGVKTLIEAIENTKNQPKLIHISSIAVYGDRNFNHPFGEVGDPLIPSVFEIYSLTKIRGEYDILESNINNFVIIRQSTVLYDDLLFNNIHDGLMFHTCFNAPLEWVTAYDSAVLLNNIINQDLDNKLNTNNFWNHCFNLAGGKNNQLSAYESFDKCFKIIGSNIETIFDPNYNVTRNFNGIWFSDGFKLENMFHYQNQTVDEFWKSVIKRRPYIKLGKLVPSKILKKIIIKPLLKDINSPKYWYDHLDNPRLIAYFKSINDYENLTNSWQDFDLICKKDNYQEIKNKPTYLEHGFDLHKDFNLIDIHDLENVANMHGGKLLTKEFKIGDIYTKVKWMNSDGVIFMARPYTILGCGHWYNESYTKNVWDFDRLSKSDKIYAQLWYDTHEVDENNYYYFDEEFNACIKKTK